MTIVDWRQVDARGLALVYARERARWLVELGWETRESWTHVERARTTWGLPGLAAIDDSGRVRGLTFFHQTGDRFDLGGVFAESDAVRASLIDAAVGVCETAGGEEIAAFVYDVSGSIGSALDARGFACERVDYLSLAFDKANLHTQRAGRLNVTWRDWQEDDRDQLPALLHTSYDTAAARRFVPDASQQGWNHYLTALIQHHACGSILPSVTRVAVVDGSPIGVVLAFDLGPATAHIAQVAVHPSWRRHGLAGALVDDAARRAQAAGYSRMTLLASASNPAAQALYRRRGYVDHGTFLSATKRPGMMRQAHAS